jgi:hypothetical protein
MVRRAALAACALAAGCAAPGGAVFGIDESTLPPGLSCARCVRSSGGAGDALGLAPCAAAILEGPASPRCAW